MKLANYLSAFAQRFLPFGNAPKVVAILVVVIALWLLPFIRSCHAAELEFSGGVAVLRGPAPVMGAKVIWPDTVAGQDFACGLMLIGASNWHGYSAHQAAIHCQVLSHLTDRISFGVGAAALQHSDQYNSGNVNFSLLMQARVWNELFVGWQHFSNAGTQMPNYGRDLVLLSWRFK